jgi:hypothetical protein
MLITINGKSCNMTKQEFDKIIKQIGESKKGSYSIYCLALKDKAELINEIFTSKEELRKKVYKYTAKKVKVFYTT